MSRIPFKAWFPFIGRFATTAAVTAVGSLLSGGPVPDTLPAHDLWQQLHDLPGAAPLATVATGILGNLATDQLKDVLNRPDYGFNGDLQRALADALDLACRHLAEQYQQANPTEDQAYVREQFEALRQSALLPGGLDNARLHQLVEAYVLNRAGFWEHLRPLMQPTGPDAAREERLLDFLLQHFPTQLEHAFLAQLREPGHERARTSFVLYLGAETLRLAHGNQQALAAAQAALTQLLERQQTAADLQQQAGQLLRTYEPQLRQLLAASRRTEQKLDDLADQHNHLRLDLPTVRLEQGTVFTYKAGYTAFIGRDAEIGQLAEFSRVRTEAPVAWLLLTGPGGVGKSRLALEYCKQLRTQGFDAGFLDLDSLPKLADHVFRRPTLLVLDYVAAYAGPVAAAIRTLHRRATAGELPQAVRLLLLERDTQGEWYKAFESHEVATCRYQHPATGRPELPLAGFGDGEHWQLITDVWRQRRPGEALPPDRDAVLAELYRLDPQRRPLFALFVGVALADGLRDRLRTWGAHELLDFILRREYELWQQHPAYAQHEPALHRNLLALATLTQGLSQAAVYELCRAPAPDGPWLPTQPHRDLYAHLAEVRPRQATDAVDEELPRPAATTRRRAAAPAAPELVWVGLQPDLLGEYFLLTHLNQLLTDPPITCELAADALMQAAWQAHPIATRDFIEKTLRDYPQHWDTPAAGLLRLPPAPDARSDAWWHWGWLCIHGTAHPFTPDGPGATPEFYYQQLVSQAEIGPVEMLAEQQAKAAFNLLTAHSRTNDLEKAVRYYDDIQALVQLWPDTISIAEQQVFAAYNLLNACGRVGELMLAAQYYTDVLELSRQWPEAPSFAEEQASAAFNLVTFYSRSGKPEQAVHYYNEIQALAQHWPETTSIVAQQAKALANLIVLHGRKSMLKQAEHYYGDLTVLHTNWPAELTIAVLRARAAGALAHFFNQASYVEPADYYNGQADYYTALADYYYEQFLALHEQFPDDIPLPTAG